MWSKTNKKLRSLTTEHIRQIDHSPELRARLRENARATRSELGWNYAADRMVRIYSDVIHQASVGVPVAAVS